MSRQSWTSNRKRVIPLIAILCWICVWCGTTMAQVPMKGKPVPEQLSESRSSSYSDVLGAPSAWLPEEPSALLVSFAVGTSLFLIVALLGTLIVFQKNLNQIRSRLPEMALIESDVHVSDSTTSEMSTLLGSCRHEVNKLDEAIEGCLEALRNSDPSEGARSDPQPLVQCLELISLQNKRLNAFHQENRMAWNLISRWDSPPVQTSFTPARQLRRESTGLSIKPA